MADLNNVHLIFKHMNTLSVLLSGLILTSCASVNTERNDYLVNEQPTEIVVPTYGANLGGGVVYNPNGMYHDNDAYYQEKIYRSKGFVTSDEAGIFFDDRPTDKYVVHNSQVCVKEPFSMTMDGRIEQVTKVKCRQPNGQFAYVP